MQDIRSQFEKNLNNLTNNHIIHNIAISVSGGSDSVALLYLLNYWQAQQKKDIKIIVLTVNHHLREEAVRECEYVIELAKNFGYHAIKFDWHARDVVSNIQSRARDGRYSLMTDYCKINHISILLTAHHLDDNIENFLIRKKRKSGIFGLSSNNSHIINEIMIIRPLYDIPKQKLIDYLIVNNIKWFEDSSNYSDQYERSRIRKFLLTAGDEFKQNIINEQQEVNQQLLRLQGLLNEAMKKSCQIYECGFAIIRLKILNNFEQVIKLQLLNFVLTIIGGQEVAPRARILYPILDLLNMQEDFIRTLHGCFIKKLSNNLLIYRQFGKKIPAAVQLLDQEAWDNRFKASAQGALQDRRSNPDLIKWLSTSDKTLTCGNKSYNIITHLTPLEYKEIKDKIDIKFLRDISFNYHKEILFTLPVIKTLEKIIAIPHISFYNERDLEEKVKIIFKPKFTSRFIHFSYIGLR